VSGLFVLRGASTIGEFVLYIALHGLAYQPLRQISIVFPRLRRNTARVERLFQVQDQPILVVDKPEAEILPAHSRAIEFDNVSFRYALREHGSEWALHNMNVVIEAGKTVALIGRSGSGKTTFINLLLRSFDPDTGAIRIDGYNLRDVTRESLLCQIAVVPQEVDLFSRTIFQNIAYGKPNAAKEEVVLAAQTALAHDFIMATEQGYDTVVGERGIKLSGGERQRIGIARAVLRDPKILILDEATSHLDTESERLIAQATDALIKNRTTIIIAHRLSTILHADMILVFDGGRLEAAGRHEELLAASPTYKRLYEFQFSET
jgi:ABC-type multidrug transport system fused ATPase/permease subunit